MLIRIETFKRLVTLRRIVITSLLVMALVFLWIAIQLEKELPQDGYVQTFDKVYTIEALKKVDNDVISPSAITYDLTFGSLNIRMVQGNLSYQMKLKGQMYFSTEGQVVISRDEALKTFGMTECIGRSYNILGRNWTVVGVLDTSLGNGILSHFQGVGKLINAIASAPKNIVVGHWGLGVNDMPNRNINQDGVKASDLGSPNMSSVKRQVNIWLSYEPSLLNNLPWQMAQWSRNENPYETAQYMRSAYALNGIIVSDTSFHATLVQQYKGFGYGFATLAVLLFALKYVRKLLVIQRS